MYADDTTVYCIGLNVDQVISSLNETMKQVLSPHVECKESTNHPSNQN